MDHLSNIQLENKIGITPDVSVDFDAEKYKTTQKDSQLEKAINIVETK